MKVAWFTPLSTRSAIAEYSTWVARAIAHWCEVELWAHGTADSRSTALPIVDFGADPSVLDELDQYDVAVYNLGNHESFHAAIYEVAQEHPGVVILHDRVLHHFFLGYWFARGLRSTYVDRMEALYGQEGRRVVEDSFAGIRPPVWEDDDLVHRFPFVEEALVGQRGAIVHASDQAEAVRERWFGPVASLFLPAYPPAEEGPLLAGRLRPVPGRVTLLTVGHVNRNKQIHRVVQAIADAGLTDRVRYLVVGPHDPNSSYVAEVDRFVRRHGLDEAVELGGYQSDEVLGTLLRQAEVLINLREPSFEGASASLMQGLALGKPTLVYDVAGFAELPDDAVVKVPPADHEALVEALTRVATNQELRRETREAALAAAAERSLERYAEKFLAFMDEMQSWTPALELCDRISHELGELDVSTALPSIDRIARETSLILAIDSPGTVEALLLREIECGDSGSLARFFVRNNVPEVVRGFDPFPLTEETAARIASGSSRDRFYGGFLGDRIVAFSMLRGWDEGYDVPSFGIAVDVDFHGAGIGTRLTAWTLDQARRLGCERIRLSVYGENETARRIYERLGFAEVERETVEHQGRMDDRIVMIKDLAA
jgi:glycosyltransferase involved in cell wall biosynthesis/RimJ/RimL family protein N-acetyltransferase